MTFDKLPIFIATHRVYCAMKCAGEEPGSDEWISTRSKDMYKKVLCQITDDGWAEDRPIHLSRESAIKIWRHLRKVKKARILCQTAIAYGMTCFWAGRIEGNCSLDVDLDRLVTGSRGGEYTVENCVITCSYHNRRRQDKTVEEYLQSSQMGDNYAAQWTIQRTVGYEVRGRDFQTDGTIIAAIPHDPS